MKKGILVILVCLLQLAGNAQGKSAQSTIDSLRKIILHKGIPDSVRSSAYLRIARLYRNSGFYDSALYYTIRGREESEKAHYQHGLLISYQLEGSIQSCKRRYNEALKGWLKALELAQQMKIEKDVIGAYLSLGGIYTTINMLDKAISYLTRALDESRKLKITDLEFKIMSNLALTYQKSGDYQKSEKLFLEVIRLQEKLKISDPMAYAAALHNAGNVEEAMGNYVSAVKNYLKASEYNKKINNVNNFLQDNLIALGSVLLKDTLNKLGKVIGDNRPSLDIAMSYLKEMEKLAINSNDTGLLVSCYMNLCQVYLARGDRETALQIGQKGWAWCKKFYEYGTYENYLGVMGKLCFSAGKFRESAIFYRDQKAYSDSLQKVETAGKIALLSNSYDVEQRDEQLKAKEQQLKNNRFITWLFIAISSLILILALIVFYFLRQKQKAAKLLEQQNREMEKAKMRAEQSEKFKEHFLASMSHEIRTPLNAVIGMTGLLLDEQQPPKTESYLRNIKQAGEHLTGIINDILDLSKMEAGKLELHEAPFSLHKLLEEMYNLFTLKAKEKGLQLIIHEAQVKTSWVSGDSGRLKQVLLNLVGNAIKFTDRGSIQIRTTAGESKGSMAMITFSVEDTGQGIPKEEQAMIFEEFVQVGQGGDQKATGTGLGLSISKMLVNRMGGTLKVESEPGKGSVFSFTIPLEISSEEAYRAIQSDKEKSLAAIKGSFRILVVDDNLSNQIVTEGMLERILPESTVTLAGNGYMAMELLEKDRFDLVLMDIRMPGIDGYETTRRLRLLKNENSGIPVVALTASVIRVDIQRCLDAGMDGYVPKPVSRELLAKTIREQLKISDPDAFIPVTGPETGFLDTLAFIPAWAPGLSDICNGKKARFINYLQLFITETDNELVKWNDLMDTEQHDPLSRSIHKIMPHIKIFTDEFFSSMAGKLEESLRSQWSPSFRENIQLLCEKILEVQKEAQAMITDMG